jgi:hypothetical protein
MDTWAFLFLDERNHLAEKDINNIKTNKKSFIKLIRDFFADLNFKIIY